MKRMLCMLLAMGLVLCCVSGAMAGEYVTLPELREQAADGWHETYTDKYGRKTSVDIDVEVFGGDVAPVVKVKPVTLEVNSGLMEEGAVFKNRTLYRNNPADDVFGARSGQITMTVHHTYGEQIDMDAVYGTEYGVSLTMRHMEERVKDVLAPHGVSLDGFVFDCPKEFSVRCKMNRTSQEVIAPAAYLAHFWQTMYGLPVFEHINRAYQRQSWPEFAPQSVIVMRGDEEYSIVVDSVKETELLAHDVPLCSFDTVKRSVKREIEAGHVQKVYSMRFGYVVYNAEHYPKGMPTVYDAESYYLVPTWVVECIYVDNAKETWMYSGKMSDELYDNEKNSPEYYLMMVNAQTGEVINRNDRSRNGKGDATYKGFIPWEDVE